MLEKTFTINLPNDTYLEIKAQEDQGSWWAVYEINFPELQLEENKRGLAGIWKDEIVFNFDDGVSLRIPPETFLSMVRVVKQLAKDKTTTWWERDEELHKKVLEAFK